MKIDNIVLSTFTENEDVLRLPFQDTRSKQPFIVKAITGMDASDIVSNFSGFGAESIPFYDMGLANRTVVIRLGLNSTFRNARTHSDLRDELYRLVAMDRSGRLKLYFCYGNGKLAFVSGKVSKLEANHFEKSTEAQLTIECDDPLLRSPTYKELDHSLLGREFSITDCISTAPHGLYFEVRLLEGTSEFILNTADTVFSVRRKFTGPDFGFPKDSVLKVSTELTNRSVTLNEGGLGGDLSILENVEGFRGSQWPMLYPGRNNFHLVTNAEIIMIKYREAFFGV